MGSYIRIPFSKCVQGVSANPWLSMALALAQQVQQVWKNQKPTQFIILNNTCFNNCLKKSIPGDVRAQVLQEPVGASHADQGRKSGLLHPFPDPGGQDESTGTPHLTLPPNPSLCQGGGRYSNIYKDSRAVSRTFGKNSITKCPQVKPPIRPATYG